MSGKLFIVPTPVGNLDDMTPRALETLRSCDLILAEDTRTSGVLLKHFGIDTPLLSHHKFNEHATVNTVVDQLIAGKNIALVSDAGTPGISDPGFMLSRECRRHDIPVETLPGATAFVPALVNSGLPCDRFCFEGFLPPKKGRATRLQEIADDSRTTVIYESPLRLVKTLMQLAEVCGGNRDASVSREISKVHETTVRGTLSELIAYFNENNPRGEIVIIVGGKTKEESAVHKNKYKNDD
ncbi:MAG: 16S rRNA (cytidine(1402)-2'-O)-methyltransferase [Paramuribaculum sp.]